MDEFPKKELERIWAPWRVEYFRVEKFGGDFLLEAARSNDDVAHLVVCRRKSAFLMMNRYPYAVGHLMAVPYRKVGEMADLTEGEKLELFDLSIHAQNLLRKVVRAQGFNLGLNIGRCAGAGVPDHLHFHIVPRWDGDNNFMPVLADTRVMPQAIEDLYGRLVEAQREESAPKA
jgi:ATP adenylyltransferase